MPSISWGCPHFSFLVPVAPKSQTFVSIFYCISLLGCLKPSQIQCIWNNNCQFLHILFPFFLISANGLTTYPVPQAKNKTKQSKTQGLVLNFLSHCSLLQSASRFCQLYFQGISHTYSKVSHSNSTYISLDWTDFIFSKDLCPLLMCQWPVFHLLFSQGTMENIRWICHSLSSKGFLSYWEWNLKSLSWSARVAIVQTSLSVVLCTFSTASVPAFFFFFKLYWPPFWREGAFYLRASLPSAFNVLPLVIGKAYSLSSFRPPFPATRCPEGILPCLI